MLATIPLAGAEKAVSVGAWTLSVNVPTFPTLVNVSTSSLLVEILIPRTREANMP